MYSESDIDGAVAAGAISPDAAAALRRHVATVHAAPAVDEEHFRLLTGFNDIFVSIAIALLLAALGQIGFSISHALGGAFVAGAAWMLAFYFTGKRRMALPSILLLLAFVGGVAGGLIGLVDTLWPHISDTEGLWRRPSSDWHRPGRRGCTGAGSWCRSPSRRARRRWSRSWSAC